MDYNFRLAVSSDIPRIMEIIEQAKMQMIRENRHQWDDNYPIQKHIMADIIDGNGYVICADDYVIAYGAVIFGDEPAYASISGKWLSNKEYVVLHRLAVADEMKGRGIATRYMGYVEKLATARGICSFKVDTNFDNVYMLRIITNLNFSYCGEIHYEGGARMAYENLIQETI
ncbi:GNAT family N-acetyltransferase [Bacteroides acidifaciens]|uniref:GNAT family N-acetyltransferase n=1 Tax=Bacteroides acidifaciens TaxID=85831 RepID=UPI00262E05CC|nr:GNAT family N-acetyltransferase [Bacteroides acidifaciens]